MVPREAAIMPQRVARNVSFTPEHAAFVAGLVASGRYGGTSEVIRAALRTFEEQETKKQRATKLPAAAR